MSKRNPYKQLIYHSKRHKNRQISAEIQRDDEELAFSFTNENYQTTDIACLREDDQSQSIESTENAGVEIVQYEEISNLLPPDEIQNVDTLSITSLVLSDSDEATFRYTTEENNFSSIVEEISQNDNNNIKNQLAKWAIDGKICHTQLNGLLLILRQHSCFSSLPKDSRTLLLTPKRYVLKNIPPGIYYHFGIKNGLLEILKSVNSSGLNLNFPDVFSLQINVDGLPLAKSSGSQLWPILANLPDFSEIRPFLIGAYHGYKKPECSNTFLEDFVNEAALMIENGFTYEDRTFKIKISAFICDAPARAFVKKIKSHTGYYGCDKCTQKGAHLGRTVFPLTNATLRTNEGFISREQERHHTGTSSLERIPGIKMISHFPHDYMHLVCLGVMRKLTLLWMKGDRSVRLSHNQTCQISSLLVKVRNFVPDDFTRKPRSLTEIDRWKATEFRQLLLYTGPFVLKNIISKKFYTHYLAFATAIRILAEHNLIEHETDQAQALIEYFLKYFSKLYGPEQMSYNVHSLVHLVNDVLYYGVVDSFSAFPFENYLQEVKKLIKKSSLPLQQLVRRISEQRATSNLNISSITTQFPIAKGVHFNGPLVSGTRNPQYSKLCFSKFSITLQPNNSCVLMKDQKLCLVSNIATISNKIVVIGQEFCMKTDFFIKPLASSKIGIYKVKELSHLKIWTVDEIEKKVLLIPLEDNYFYAAVLLH